MSHESSSSQSKPWAAFGVSCGDREDMLEGNREGLLLLRQAIDQALESGESYIEEASVEMAGVWRCDEPRALTEGSLTTGTKLAMAGCLGLVLLAAFIFIIGLIQVIHFMSGFRS